MRCRLSPFGDVVQLDCRPNHEMAIFRTDARVITDEDAVLLKASDTQRNGALGDSKSLSDISIGAAGVLAEKFKKGGV